MNEFIGYILQFGNLNQQQIELISKKMTELELRKGEYFWEAGKAITLVGFITGGIIRVCYYNDQGEESTRYFIDENHLIINWMNIDINFTPSEYLQAVTDCKLIVFSKQDWKDISDTIVSWDNIIQKIITNHHTEKLKRRSPLVSMDATTRYLKFLEQFPTLANRVPLSYIASYLGITQSSLSRIRKNIR
jgi:CRP-like cAMP-binding protein